jgi:hypothetical protein
MKLERLVCALPYYHNGFKTVSASLKNCKGDMGVILNYHMMSQKLSMAPIVEKQVLTDYLDITGMDRFHGAYKWTNELERG